MEKVETPNVLNQNVYAEADWDAYAKYRPTYPNSLVNLILEHHRLHSNNRFRLAHDIGTGSGNFAGRLLEHFAHTHVSDPDDANIERARIALDCFVKMKARETEQNTTRPLAGTVTLGGGSAEMAHKGFLPGSVDLISMAESAHWTEIETTIRAAAEALAPGGTLAIIYYHVLPRVVDDLTEIQLQWAKLTDAVLCEITKASSGPSIDSSARVAPVDRYGSMGNDYISLPDDLFDASRTQRIKLNVYGQGLAPFRFIADPAGWAPSKVRAMETVLEYNHPDPQALGWRYLVGKGWLRQLLLTLPPLKEHLHVFEESLSELDDSISAVAGGRITVEFPATVMLATRRL